MAAVCEGYLAIRRELRSIRYPLSERRGAIRIWCTGCRLKPNIRTVFDDDHRDAGRVTLGKSGHKAVAADKGLSTLGRRSTSRGRAAFEMNEGRRAAPAVLLSTIT